MPKSRNETTDNALSIIGRRIWNNLPENVTNSLTLDYKYISYLSEYIFVSVFT